MRNDSGPDLTALPLCFQPPVQVYGIEGRYATALYSAASKQKKLDQVEKELLRVGVRSEPVGRGLHCSLPLFSCAENHQKPQKVPTDMLCDNTASLLSETTMWYGLG